MRTLASIAAALALLLIPVPAEAQGQMLQPCAADETDTRDLAGSYVSPANRMRITVYLCGGTSVLWENEYGMHEAGYLANERTEAGGFIARVVIFDPLARSLDGRNTIWVKPAEVGYIQAITVSPFGTDLRVYRLKKV